MPPQKVKRDGRFPRSRLLPELEKSVKTVETLVAPTSSQLSRWHLANARIPEGKPFSLREDFFKKSSDTDEELRPEFQSLLAFETASGSFLDAPQTFHRVLTRPNLPLFLMMPLSIGDSTHKETAKSKT